MKIPDFFWIISSSIKHFWWQGRIKRKFRDKRVVFLPMSLYTFIEARVSSLDAGKPLNLNRKELLQYGMLMSLKMGNDTDIVLVFDNF